MVGVSVTKQYDTPFLIKIGWKYYTSGYRGSFIKRKATRIYGVEKLKVHLAVLTKRYNKITIKRDG